MGAKGSVRAPTASLRPALQEGLLLAQPGALAASAPQGIIAPVTWRDQRKEDLLDLLERARRIVDTLAARFGSDILLLDLSGLTIIADFFVIATGESVRQLDDMCDHLRTRLKEDLSVVPLAVEGTAESGWMLLDYGSIVVHLFSEAQRERYRLEELWSDAHTVVRMA